MPLLARVVDVFTMREAVTRAGLGSMADAQSLDRDALEDLWRELWRVDRATCYQAIRWARYKIHTERSTGFHGA